MEKFIKNTRGVVAVLAIAFAAVLPSEGALAQVVTQLPTNIIPGTVSDLGNGPLELRILQGNALLFTEQGSGLGSTSGASTTLTLTASAAANPPCVGCIISGTGITSGTTVAAFNGTTGITLSATMTVVSNTPLSWGMACPLTPGGVPVVPVQANVGADIPMYTQARICAAGGAGPGASLLPFPIGAH